MKQNYTTRQYLYALGGSAAECGCKNPNRLVTTGVHASQVPYFEPSKWIAKLRKYKTDKSLLLQHNPYGVSATGSYEPF
ncbi:hypothetical protein [Adhaeribacter pallidiroseus]|uniref:Oligopeptidase B n=1 Tax=Adhaeribacter pallidiroseus TaxID=2072847 RepID=A0A369QFT3_9BACT|nr:hypothetical protein [Adhaeribacter pallidiroseus]RDC62127.1 Oligopeptidase B [Adhaeribacter pallidiroseus]